MLRKPDWIRVRAPGRRGNTARRASVLREHGLVTVCEEAGCPNIGECWAKRHATMMIMGDTCTRACAFCNVRDRPARARSIRPSPTMSPRRSPSSGLEHVVITSVDRDDLADGGAEHFAQTIRAIRAATPATTIEVLTPDFLRKDGALETVVGGQARRLQPQPRDGARALSDDPARRALLPLAAAAAAGEGARPARCSPSRASWSGWARTRRRSLQVMDDLRSADVDFLTIGQYLQPTRKHAEVKRFVPPDEFKALRDHGARQGLPAGVGEPADALVLSRRRGLRAAEGRAAAAQR